MAFVEEYIASINSSVVGLVKFVTIVIMGLVLGRFLGKLVHKVLRELDFNIFLSGKLKIMLDLETLLGRIVNYSIIGLFMFYALEKIGIPGKFYMYILGILLFLLLLYISLELKDFIYNWIIGKIFLNRSFLEIGQRIRIKDIEGEIIKVSATEIKVRTSANDTYIIPNLVLRKSYLFKKD